MVRSQMEEALYRTATAHERAQLALAQSEKGVVRRDAIIAEMSAELAERREAMLRSAAP